MKNFRMMITIFIVIYISCDHASPIAPNNTNAFYNTQYEQCQLETVTEDLVTTDVNRFLARQFTGSRQSMPYRLFIPDNYVPERSYPLVLYLHGGGGRGTDNRLQITSNANLVASHIFITPEVQYDHPCFVVVPQIQEADGIWASFDSTTLSDNLITALEILEALKLEFNIDHQRIYALGNSLGGGGSWDLVTKTSNRFAAIVPIASDVRWGGIGAPTAQQPALIASVSTALKGKTFWFFYGNLDGNGALKPWWDQVVDLLRKAGEDPRYTEYINGGHSIFRCVFTDPNLIPWLFSQKLE